MIPIGSINRPPIKRGTDCLFRLRLQNGKKKKERSAGKTKS